MSRLKLSLADQHLAPGRYLLDRDGKLHALTSKPGIRGVAIVTVRMKRAEHAPSPPQRIARAPIFRPKPVVVPIEEFDDDPVEIVKPAHVIDWKRAAAAHAARKVSAAPKARKAPLRHAVSTDPCAQCGIPGFRGCDHWLPFEVAK